MVIIRVKVVWFCVENPHREMRVESYMFVCQMRTDEQIARPPNFSADFYKEVNS